LKNKAREEKNPVATLQQVPSGCGLPNRTQKPKGSQQWGASGYRKSASGQAQWSLEPNPKNDFEK
jgi:hypothetical protein